MEGGGRRAATLGGVTVLAAIWFALAASGRLHWDEPGYWYDAAYHPVSQILAGDFQPSGIEGFTASRVGHILLLKGLMAPFGPGPDAVGAILAAYLLLLAAFLGLARAILVELRPDAPGPGLAVLVCAFVPVVVYLGFKSVAETPALTLASAAAYAFLRALRGPAPPWLALCALALGGVAFTKNHLVILPVSMIAALVLCGGRGHRVSRVLAHATVAGMGALLVFAVVSRIAGIPLDRYLSVAHFVRTIHDPPEARFLSLALECGAYFLALPVAFLRAGHLPPAREAARRADAWFHALWFALATLPMLLGHRVEDRYLVGNLVAMAGLVHGALPALAAWLGRGTSRPLRGTVALLGAVGGILLPAALAQRVMFHGVRAGDLAGLLRGLDAEYGPEGYAVLTPSEYTTFLYLRVADPDREVYTVFTAGPPDHRDPAAWGAFQDRFYGSRVVRTRGDLRAVGKPLVYVGPESDLSVAGAAGVVESLPVASWRAWGEGFIRRMDPFNPLALSWMWTDPAVRLQDAAHRGAYTAMRVDVLAGLDGE